MGYGPFLRRLRRRRAASDPKMVAEARSTPTNVRLAKRRAYLFPSLAGSPNVRLNAHANPPKGSTMPVEYDAAYKDF